MNCSGFAGRKNRTDNMIAIKNNPQYGSFKLEICSGKFPFL